MMCSDLKKRLPQKKNKHQISAVKLNASFVLRDRYQALHTINSYAEHTTHFIF